MRRNWTIILFACQSFAWFTSKDEVTNRLTANSDYGVSIVESFAPPKNWLPGQDINKDVYAVNTGTVDAFVKETVTGKLNYTYEQVIDTWDVDCVRLDDTARTIIDGATTEEAGGFLAWTTAKVDDGNGTMVDYPTGPVNSARQQETPAVADPWTPPASGIYIFRRAIDTDGVNILNDEIPTFTYAGYYCVKAGNDLNGAITADPDNDRYYEIVIGGDTHPTDGNDQANDGAPYAQWNFDMEVKSNNLGAGVTVNKDGVITGNPAVRYVKEYQVQNADAVFTYDDGTTDANKPATLTVNYVPAQTNNDNVTATNQALTDATNAYNTAKAAEDALKVASPTYSADAAQKETDYENALGEYNTKLSRYNQTKADFDYATDLAAATNALYDAADARAVFQAQLNAAQQAMNDAWDDNDATDVDSVKEKAAAMVDATGTGTYANVINMSATNQSSPVSFKSLFGDASNTAPAANTLASRINYLASTYASDSRFQSIKSNMDEMHGLWDDIQTLLNGIAESGTPGTPGYVAADPGIIADLTTLSTSNSGDLTSAQVKEIRERLDTKLSALKTKMELYNNAYASLTSTASTEQTLTEIIQGTSVAAVASTKNLTDDLYDTEFKNATTGLEKLMKDYENAYDIYTGMADTTHPTQAGTLGKADKDWQDAVDTYNSALDTAYGNANTVGSYLYDVSQIQPELNGFNRLQGSTPKQRTLKDQSAAIIATYSATGAGDGKFDVTSNYPDYKNYTIDSGVAPEVPASDPVTYAVPAYDSTSPSTTAEERKATDSATFKQVAITTADHELVNESYNGGSAAAPEAITLDDLETAKDGAYATVYGTGTPDAPAANSKKKLYDDAKAAKQAIEDAEAATAEALTAKNNAQRAYDNALQAGSPVKIIINLADDADQMGWTYDSANTGATAGTEANFYLNKVLAAGETSDKLIDSVYLDKDTTSKAYKTLVFDLNVGLDSIQVTYDADQRNYTTEAVNSDPTFAMTAATTAGSDAVTWS